MDSSAAEFDFGSRELAARELGWTGEQAHAHEHAGDRELASGLRRGVDAAYELLLSRFEHPVFSLVFRLLHRPAEAEDVTQEVFLKVFRSIGSFRGDSSLKTWIYRIAVNEARNHLRKASRRTGHEVGLEDEACEGLTWEERLEDQHLSPFDAAWSGELEAAIEAALGQLKPCFREAVVLRDVEQLTYLEIAAITGEHVATIKTRILRGRRSLRQLLGETLAAAAVDRTAEAPGAGTASPAVAVTNGDGR